ncbi:ROK family protein [Caldicellulosiruptoraceae bacterium PP1]
MYYIGIDLGGTNIAAGIVDESGKILKKGSVPTGAQRHYTEIMKDMAELSLNLIREVGLSVDDVHSIGIGSPGTPDNINGKILYSNNIAFLDVPMREEIQKYINKPVNIENDANCAAFGEYIAGGAKDSKISVTVTLGTGIGGGIIIEGRIFTGTNHAGAELGHTVICVDGEQCTCGRKGCWEAYASATALIRMTRESAARNINGTIMKLVNGDISKIDAKTAFDAKRLGDAEGERIVDLYTKYLAEGLSNIYNIFEPEVICIGGGVSKEGDYLLDPVRKIVYDRIYCKQLPKPRIIPAVLGNDAGIIGAALLAKQI